VGGFLHGCAPREKDFERVMPARRLDTGARMLHMEIEDDGELRFLLMSAVNHLQRSWDYQALLGALLCTEQGIDENSPEGELVHDYINDLVFTLGCHKDPPSPEEVIAELREFIIREDHNLT